MVEDEPEDLDLYKERDFITWIEVNIDAPAGNIHDTDKLEAIVKKLQIELDEDDFIELITFADNECNCDNYPDDRKCMYCRIFMITGNMTTSTYLGFEPLDPEEHEDLK